MSRATVLRCDRCAAWDSEQVTVRTVSVTGPKLDLCTACRAWVLIQLGVREELSVRYHLMVDERVPVRGSYPALAAAKGFEPREVTELSSRLSYAAAEPVSQGWTVEAVVPESDIPESGDVAPGDSNDPQGDTVEARRGGRRVTGKG